MGHEKKTNSQKNENHQINDTFADAIKKAAENNRLTCAAAHKIAKNLQATPQQVGIQIDLLEYTIIECQVGLFGYADGQKGFDPDIDISDALDAALDKAAENQRVSCENCWNIAKKMKMKKIDVGSACEKKQIRIKPCQLGFF